MLILFLFFSAATVTAQLKDTVSINKKTSEIYQKRADSLFAFTAVQEVISSSEKLNYPAGKAAGVQARGYLYLYYGDYTEAEKCLLEALPLAKATANQDLLAKNLRLLGIIFENKGELTKALDYLMQCLQIREKQKDEKGIAECYNSIGIVYQQDRNLSKAVYYFKKALDFFSKNKDEYPVQLSALYINLGSNYNMQMNLDTAIIFLEKAVVIKKEINDVVGLSKCYHNLGSAYHDNGEFKKAFDYYMLSIELTPGGEMSANNLSSVLAISSALINMGNYAEAKKYLEKGEKIAEENGLHALLVDAYGFYAEMYMRNKQYSLAHYYNAKVEFMEDSLKKAEVALALADIETKYQTQQKINENNVLKETQESQAIYLRNLVVLLALVISLSVILGIFLRKTRKSSYEISQKNEIIQIKNNEITVQNVQLEALVKENHSLVGILAHDLRSPFSKIIGLADLMFHESDEELKKKYLQYIESISREGLRLIQDTIDLSRMSTPALFEVSSEDKEFFYPDEVVQEMLKGFYALSQEKSIFMELRDGLPGMRLFTSKEYFVRIVDNILSNAIKFSPMNSRIVISTAPVGNKVLISIRDEGPGISEADKEKLFLRFQKLSARPTGSETSTGLGLFIAKQLSLLINGNIYVVSEEGKGAEFILELPVV